MSDLELGVGVTGVDAAIRDLGRVTAAETQVGAAAQSATQAASAGTSQWTWNLQRASAATRQTGSSVSEMAQRVQGAASQVSSLSNALGSSAMGRGVGLVAALAGTVAQAAQLGQQFGPAGAVVGALSGAVPIVMSLAQAFEEASIEQSEWRGQMQLTLPTLDQMISRTRDLAAATRREGLISQGLGTLDEQIAARDRAGERVGIIGAQRARVREQLTAMQDEGVGSDRDSQQRFAHLTSEMTRLTTEFEAARADAQRLAELAAQVIDEEQEIAEDIGSIALEDTVAQGRRSAAQRAAEAQAIFDAAENAAAERLAAFQERQRAVVEARVAREQEMKEIEEASERAQEEAEQRAVDRAKELDERRLERSNELAQSIADHQKEVTQAAVDAQKAFSNGWVSSIDEVVQAFNEANQALRQAGQQMLSTSRLMERGLTAVGNNIADTIGGTMKGAFESALGAWLDGSKSFVEAAEEMAKGVIKALVVESIVQTVVELARGIAAIAGQDYVSAPLHFAAAAAWAGVGVVAGGIGAATGAIGGGGKGAAAQPTNTTDLSNRSVREESRADAPVTYNLIFGYPVVTESVVRGELYRVLNQGARDGHRLDERAIRGRTG